jgi:hypothetical protein
MRPRARPLLTRVPVRVCAQVEVIASTMGEPIVGAGYLKPRQDL